MKSSALCLHELVPPEKAVWIPGRREIEGVMNPSVKRRYCVLCGKFHYIGTHRGRKLNYWIDFLSRFSRAMNRLYRRERKISKPMTETQRRLIQEEMESHEDFLDLFSVTFSHQQEVFEELVRAHTGISERELEVVYQRMEGY